MILCRLSESLEACMWLKASAPGSLMLLGEYAVLNEGYALVAAVNQRMTVRLTPRDDVKVKIFSQLGNLETDIFSLEIQSPFQFVLFTLKKYQAQLPSGCEIVIEAEFSDQLGFGSSAAVTVALVTVLHAWFNHSLSNKEIMLESRSIIRSVQGLGSGADVAASVFGGVLAYKAEPVFVEQLAYHYPFTAVYSGSKTKTAVAVAKVNEYFSNRPEIFQKILAEINQCAQLGIAAVRANNHIKLGQMMNAQQKLMEDLMVSTPELKQSIDYLLTEPQILGAKISGSGFGDCAIGLGACELELKNIFPINIASKGVCCEQG